MSRLLCTFLGLATVLVSLNVRAHEVRPAYLEITQRGPATFKVTWKQPTMGSVAVHLVPHLSNGWLEQPATQQYVAEGFLIRSWTIDKPTSPSLAGVTVTIEGLEDTITDAFVRVRLANDQHLDKIVRPEKPSFAISLANGNAMSLWSFLRLGIEHILTGPDHLSFVLGLILIVRDRWMLLKTVSAFTVAHSITLAATTFGIVTAPSALLDTMIALSILFLAPEVLRAQRGGTSLTIRFPWIVAFTFGLVHGMGFAGALTALGLDQSTLIRALVMFNLGVEVGQLTFIAIVLALIWGLARLKTDWPKPVSLAPTYAIGSLGAMWTFHYGAIAFGLGTG